MPSLRSASVLAGIAAAVVLVSASASRSVGPMPAPLACPVAQLGVTSVAQMNAAATQGCVLPALDPVALAPMGETAVGSVAIGVPRRTAGLSRDRVIAGALTAGLTVSVLSSRDDGETRRCEC